MRSRMIRTVAVLVAVMLVGGSASLLAAPGDPSEADAGDVRAITGITDLVNHGTDWTPQVRSKFAMWKPFGWGTEAKVKAAGDQWVHMPIPYLSRISDTLVKVEYVEFCAKSSNGALTKPVTLDIWDGTGTRVKRVAVAWPADNAMHCKGYTFSPAVWIDGLGISVSLHFANTVDKITLYKAWARVKP